MRLERAVGGVLVHRHGGAAVGARWDDAHATDVPSAGLVAEEAADGLRAVHRPLRRHVHHGVLTQQRHDAFDVDSLPGIHVAAQ